MYYRARICIVDFNVRFFGWSQYQGRDLYASDNDLVKKLSTNNAIINWDVKSVKNREQLDQSFSLSSTYVICWRKPRI